MPNLNAVLACAQLEKYLDNKLELAESYSVFFKNKPITFVKEPKKVITNYWLNVVLLENLEERNQFLEPTNGNVVMTRPVWELINRLPMFEKYESDKLENCK